MRESDETQVSESSKEVEAPKQVGLERQWNDWDSLLEERDLNQDVPISDTTTAWRTLNDTLAHRTVLSESTARAGFERLLLPGVDVCQDGWDRAHSLGAWSGVESPYGILYAPEEVNRGSMRQIERYIQESYKNNPEGTRLVLYTETEAHPDSLRLKEITYRLDRLTDSGTDRLFEVSLSVADDKENPRVSVSVQTYSATYP